MNGAFSETLSKLRQARGVSQKVAAAQLGVSQALLSHYENGIREPGLEFVCRACDYYGVSSDLLLGRTGKDGPNQDSSGSIQLRLMADSVGIMAELMQRLEDPESRSAAWDYASVVYLRMLLAMAPDQTAALSGMSVSDLQLKSSAAQVLTELELRKAVADGPQEGLSQCIAANRDTLNQMIYSAVERLNRL